MLSAKLRLNCELLPFTETNVGLPYESGYLGRGLHVLKVQAEDTAQRSADAVSSASR